MAQNTYRQALVSNDADFVKKVRASYKGKVTRLLNTLTSVLIKVDNNFDHANIDHEEILQLVEDLRGDKVAISELHIRYEVLRFHPDDSEAENAFIEKDSNFIVDIENNIRAGLRLFNAYVTDHKSRTEIISNQDKLAKKIEQYPAKLRAFKAQSSIYENASVAAEKVVSSVDDNILRTSAHYKIVLQDEFEKLVSFGNSLLEIVPNVAGTDQADIDLFECGKAKLDHMALIANLERVSKEVELRDKMALAKVAKPSEICTAVGGHSSGTDKPNIVKLKVKPPTFSGRCRDFPVFKRDFNTIVAVADRSDIEIGALLKECIPDKWKYLLDKVNLSDHEEMMTILTAKFGRARLIVDECTAEIRNMKIINSDKEFITFVEKMDKIKRDLEQLHLLSDIANTTVIVDLESKLPYAVKRDWIKIVSSKDCVNMTPSEIFKKLLEFLEDTKLQAEYHDTEIRSVASCGRASTKLEFVCGVKPGPFNHLVNPIKKPPRNQIRACLACSDGSTDLDSTMHSTGSCAVWSSLTLKEKIDKVNCIKCPFWGKDTNHNTDECRKTKFKCHNCLQENDHHTWFCESA